MITTVVLANTSITSHNYNFFFMVLGDKSQELPSLSPSVYSLSPYLSPLIYRHINNTILDLKYQWCHNAILRVNVNGFDYSRVIPEFLMCGQEWFCWAEMLVGAPSQPPSVRVREREVLCFCVPDIVHSTYLGLKEYPPTPCFQLLCYIPWRWW